MGYSDGVMGSGTIAISAILIVIVLIVAFRLRSKIQRGQTGAQFILRGNELERKEQFQEAVMCYLNAEAVYNETGDDGGRAKAFCLAGLAELKRSDPKEARNFFRKAEPLAREASSPEDIGFLLMNMGDVEDELGHFKKSKKYYSDAAEVYEACGDMEGLMFAREKIEYYAEDENRINMEEE